MDNKWVYAFAEGDGKNKKLLGGKGANLCEMTRIGLNVPPGFVITTEACLACLATPERRLPGVVYDALDVRDPGIDALLGLFVGSALVLWVALLAEALLRKEAMGFGDVKYLGALGAFVGWQGAVFAMFGGAVVGCVWFLVAYGCSRIALENVRNPDLGMPVFPLGLTMGMMLSTPLVMVGAWLVIRARRS